MTLHIGQRVQTPLGAGSILGFEQFNAKGFSAPTSETDTGNRVIVRLDKPENWMATQLTPDPYMFRSQLQSLNEEQRLEDESILKDAEYFHQI